MSRFIEGRDNFLWFHDSSVGKSRDMIIIALQESIHNIDIRLATKTNYLNADIFFTTQDEWDFFRPQIEELARKRFIVFREHELDKLAKDLNIDETILKRYKHDIYNMFSLLKLRCVWIPLFTILSEDLLSVLNLEYDPVFQTHIKTNYVPLVHRANLLKITNNADSTINYCIKYSKAFMEMKKEIHNRKEYEHNLELYDSNINKCPDDIIDIIKGYIILEWVHGTTRINRFKRLQKSYDMVSNSRKNNIPDRSRKNGIQSNDSRNGIVVKGLDSINRNINNESRQSSRSYIGYRRHFYSKMRPVGIDDTRGDDIGTNIHFFDRHNRIPFNIGINGFIDGSI